MRQTCHRIVLLLSAALASTPCFAQEVAPDVLLKGITQDVLAIIRQDREIQAGNPAKIAGLVETKILPHFDFVHMTQSAAARSWRLATLDQQRALTIEFRMLLVRTYSTALASYRDQAIEFRPLHAASGATEVTVKSLVREAGTAPLTIDYDLELLPTGWKVYDIKIGGVSLVTTYRDTFANKVRESGVEGLIRSLEEKNRQGEIRTRPRQPDDAYFPGIVRSFLSSFPLARWLFQ